MTNEEMLIEYQKIRKEIKHIKDRFLMLMPISIEYLNDLNNRIFYLKIFLNIDIVIVYFLHLICILDFIYLISVIIFFRFFLYLKEFLIRYRIQKDIFGTNRAEARELIDFIIKNSDNLDFTDSNGNLRRALLPEAKDAVEEHIPGILGEEVRA